MGYEVLLNPDRQRPVRLCNGAEQETYCLYITLAIEWRLEVVALIPTSSGSLI